MRAPEKSPAAGFFRIGTPMVYTELTFLLLNFAIAVPVLAGSQNPDELLQKASSALNAGDTSSGISDLREYLKMRPDSPEVRTNLGVALAHEGQYAEAIHEYDLALKLLPNNPGIVLNLGLAYYKAGQIQEAAHELERGLRLAPGNDQVAMLLADCYLRQGENSKVVTLLEPLQGSHADSLGFIYLLGTALVRDKQVERGQVLIDKILRNGDSAEARLLIATTKMTVNDYSGARDDLAKAVELNPKLPDVYSYYGMALLTTGDSEGAERAFHQELVTNPRDFTANLQLGALLKGKQEYLEAGKYLSQALQSRPGDIGVRYQIATVALATGKTEEALRELEGIIKESPHFTEAHVSLATVYFRLNRRVDGDRERTLVRQLNEEAQAKQPGVRPTEAHSAAADAAVPESKLPSPQKPPEERPK